MKTARVQGDAAARKAQPIARGCLDYFPDALLAVAELSRIGNEQHNPGQPMHWAKEKSTDEADALLRHLIDRGTVDTDGVRHSTKVAWRALALLQREIDAERGVSATETVEKTQLAGQVVRDALAALPPLPSLDEINRDLARRAGRDGQDTLITVYTDQTGGWDCRVCGRPECEAACTIPLGG